LLLIVQATALGAVGDYFLTDRPWTHQVAARLDGAGWSRHPRV